MKPILFNTEMVRAILDGRKTVTRRVVKPQPKDVHRVLRGPLHKKANTVCFDCGWKDDDPRTGYIETVKLPHSPGDILYVRETWTKLVGSYLYKANQKPGMKHPGKWNPSIHMPREAARIFLRVTDVRVERLQEILTDDCLAPSNIQAEGLTKPCILCIHPDFDCREYIKSGNCDLAREFIKLWDSTIKPADRDLYGWEANPWVWVIEFKKISKEAADGLDHH